MSNSIKISPKYGVNPTIPVCFYCGEQKNEIALLGKLPNDQEAPRNLILDYVPCDKCKSNMALGITLIAVTEEKISNLPIAKIESNEIYPTGSWMVITENAAKRYFDEPQLSAILEKRKCYVPQEFIDDLNRAHRLLKGEG